MIVVGGIYDEQVTIPDHRELAGSGLRAAAALGPNRAKLVTAVNADTAPLAASAAAALGVTLDTVERDQPVGFRYFSPVTPPSIDGPSATHAAPLVADDDTVLVFGTVETGPRSVRAGRLVVDPQRPRDLTGLDLEGLQADTTTVLANAREARALAGGTIELASAARQVRAASGAVAVVVKDGARGCLVLTGDGDGILTRVGAYPTRSVWPLGSGDVFAAAYAHAWDQGAEPVEAARIASSSAAWRCGTRATVVPSRILAGASVGDVLEDAGAELVVPDDEPLVYLAAPFSPSPTGGWSRPAAVSSPALGHVSLAPCTTSDPAGMRSRPVTWRGSKVPKPFWPCSTGGIPARSTRSGGRTGRGCPWSASSRARRRRAQRCSSEPAPSYTRTSQARSTAPSGPPTATR